MPLGKASTQSEKAHTKTSKHLQPWTQGSSVKSMTIFSHGAPLTLCTVAAAQSPWHGLLGAHIHSVHILHGQCWEVRDVEMSTHLGLESCLAIWVF